MEVCFLSTNFEGDYNILSWIWECASQKHTRLPSQKFC